MWFSKNNCEKNKFLKNNHRRPLSWSRSNHTARPARDKLACSSHKTVSSFIVECRPGTYYDADEWTCILCERGSYQPRPAQSVCLRCPDDMTTFGRGAAERRECCE